MTAAVERAAQRGPDAYAVAMTDPEVPHVWRHVAQDMLSVGVRVAEVSATLREHGALQPEGEETGEFGEGVILEDDTPWFCNACNEYVGTGVDFETVVATHQAHMVRLAIVGS